MLKTLTLCLQNSSGNTLHGSAPVCTANAHTGMHACWFGTEREACLVTKSELLQMAVESCTYGPNEEEILFPDGQIPVRVPGRGGGNITGIYLCGIPAVDGAVTYADLQNKGHTVQLTAHW